jgi:FMN phosphatase YigB (HAD superfamily)/DNA-binding XRE family transcriptional regulator
MDEVGLGRQLQRARQAAGLTQQQLCQRANLSYSTLAKIERGAIKSPSIFTIHSIADTLGISLNALLGIPENTGRSVKKRSQSGVRFVYFDINGCLVRFYHRAFTRIAQESGKSEDIIETMFWQYNDTANRGDFPMDEFNRILGDAFELDNFDWRKYYLDAIEPIDDMRTMLEWASEHYHVGLLSNILPGLIKQMIEKGYLPDLSYDVIIDSSEVGFIKPEPEIFELAQSKANVTPEEILLIDDTRANLMAAGKAGWHTMWFDGYRTEESTARIREALEPVEE